MVTRYGGRAVSGVTSARPLAAAPARLAWLVLAAVAAVALPQLGTLPTAAMLVLLAGAAAVLVGLRLVADRGSSLACWSWAGAVVAVVVLSALSGPVTGDDPASVLLLPLAVGC